MRHIQTFSLFESVQILTQDQKEFLDKCTIGTWSLNPSTGLVDVEGDFDCSRYDLKDFLGVRFGKVWGKFDCDSNYIKSLEGAPQTVRGGFSCSYNNLTYLEGAPQTVGGDFTCHGNKLTSLAGAPQTVGGRFSCSYNSLTSLEGAPKTVGGNFDCRNNSLTSLSGAPQTIGGDFECSTNNLKSLEGAPEIVGKDFYCANNRLKSLTGAPETVGKNFYCHDNNLSSLVGAPQTIGGDFDSDHLKISEGKWSIETLIEIFLTGTPKQKQLIEPLVDPKVLQQQIDQNPEGMLVKLKGYLKHPHLQGLKWPERLDQEKGLLSGLADIGL